MDIDEVAEILSETKYEFSNINHFRIFEIIRQINPGKGTIIGAAEHDIIYLDVTDFSQATEKQIVELGKLGVFVQHDSLAMFV